jgi:hypothetical protein
MWVRGQGGRIPLVLLSREKEQHMKKLMLLAAALAMVIVAAVPAIAQISQENEQDADSGDVDQSFTVTGGGDNSNQCVGLQGTANTGNAQNQIGVLQYGSEADDFEFDETGASIDVSPTNTTSCDQQVNQAASAFGG